MNADADAQHAAAQAACAALWSGDRASQVLGMAVQSVTPTSAVLTMTVRSDMLNGHGICHGGLVASLADSAFAFACNAAGTPHLAAGFSIELLAPAMLGDQLTAHAQVVQRSGRSGVCDVAVTNQHGACIAMFRGRSHARPSAPVPVVAQA